MVVYAIVVLMDTILTFLKQAFVTLFLKPADFLLFGGSGVLWRSREEWQQIMRDAGRDRVIPSVQDDAAAVTNSFGLERPGPIPGQWVNYGPSPISLDVSDVMDGMSGKR